MFRLNDYEFWLHVMVFADMKIYLGYHKLGLPICTLSPEQSRFFKRHYNNDKHNLGVLVREMDVIRKLEGW